MWLFSALIFMLITVVTSESQTECPAKFVGPKCEVPICNPFNGELVYHAPDGYFCKCADGFVGTHCETLVCQNGGIVKGSTECDCSKTGFTGRFCNVGTTPKPKPVKKDEGSFIFAVTLCFYTYGVFFVFLIVSTIRGKGTARVDAPYLASRQESKLRNFFYYTFISKNVKLW